MIFVKKIKMKYGCLYSNNLTEIDELYLVGSIQKPGYYKKEDVHNYLKDNPGTIAVDVWPYPKVIPSTSVYGEKYVRSTSNIYEHDNLLNLHRE